MIKQAFYKKYLLFVLLVISASNYVDRAALGLVMQDIKVDLSVSDTQLGLLTGIAFALFYSLMGIPLARWADRGNRVTIISITTALWSAAVALCGLAGNFLQLLLIRIGAAVGEAGCIPSAHSLIADYFDRAERPRAFARYMLGGPLSVVIGYFMAGWLNEFYGWRITFVLLGLPGVGLAALAWVTLQEPRSAKAKAGRFAVTAHALPQESNSGAAQPGLREVCATLWANSTFCHLLVCISVMSFFGYGLAQWQAAFFIRSYGLETGELGTWFALIYGVGGLLGTYLGGEFASRHAAHDERLQLKALALAFVVFVALTACVYLSTNLHLAFGLMAIAAVWSNTAAGPLFALVQTLVPPRMRAVAIAIVFLFANLIGMGLGPLAVGALSDALRPLLGEESLRGALLALCPGYLCGSWHLWRASRTIPRDLAGVSVHPESGRREENALANEPMKTIATDISQNSKASCRL